MRTLSVLFAALLAALPLSAAEFSIVAWNIEWFPGQRMREVTPEMEKEHMEAAREELREMDPDVLLGAEIRNWKFFDQLVSVVPGLKVVNVSRFPDRDYGELWLQQTAIASKGPVVVAGSEAWESTIGALSRGFSFAALELYGGEVVLIYSLHLKSNRSRNEEEEERNYRLRDESIRQLLHHVERMEEVMFADEVAGVVVGGDMNTNHDGQFGDNVVDMLVDAGFTNTWAGVPRPERATWRGSEQYRKTTFDYIFIKGERLSADTAEMIEVPEEVSDHHAVELTVEVE